MLRNKMRVRFADKGLSEELCKYLSNNNNCVTSYQSYYCKR